MKKILFVSTERIGDSIALTPTIRAVAKNIKDAEIELICKTKNFDVFSGNPYLKKVRTKNKLSLYGSKIFPPQKVYDICLCYSINDDFISFASQISHKVFCFKNKNLQTNYSNIELYELPPPLERNNTHIAVEKFELAKSLDIKHDNFRYDLFLNQYEIVFGKNLKSKYYDKFEKLICLKIASDPKKSYRDWPKKNFKELISLILNKNKNVGFIIIGSSSEKKLINEITQRNTKNIFTHIGQPIKHSASIISICDLYIGVDTGMTHIATCFNIPIIGIYHELNPFKRGGPFDYPNNYSLDMKNFIKNKNEENNIGIIKPIDVYRQVFKAIGI